MADVLLTVAVLAVAAAAGAAVLRLALSLSPRTLAERGRQITAVAAIAAAVGAVWADGEPTGLAELDAIYRAALAALVVFLAARGRRRAVLLACGLALAASSGNYVAVACSAAALGGSVRLAAGGLPRQAGRALVGMALSQAVLRLSWPRTPGATAVVAGTIVVLLAAAAYPRLTERERFGARLAALTVAVIAVVVGVALAIAVNGARADLEAGADAAEEGFALARSGRGKEAATALRRAEGDLADAHDRLSSPSSDAATALPLLGRYVRPGLDALRTTVRALGPAASAAERLDDPGLRLTGGRIDLRAVERIVPPLQAAVGSLSPAEQAVAELSGQWLPKDAAQRVDGFHRRLERAKSDGENALAAARIAPAMLGSGGDRRYFLAIETPAEQRASGGIVGNWGELSLADGKLGLVATGRQGELSDPDSPRPPVGPADYQRRYREVGPWRFFLNATMTPDFPTAASVMEEIYEQEKGTKVGGTVTMNPIALSALLQLTGPISVDGWPEPISADNAQRVLLHDQYVVLAGPPREDFLARVTEAVVGRLTSGSLPGPAEMARVLGPMVRDGHLMLHSASEVEQRVLEQLRAAGAMLPVRGDYLQVVTQNAGESKIDYFQRREVTYEPAIDATTGEIEAKLRIRIHNDAPATGLPEYVIGGRTAATRGLGVSELWLNVYTPLELASATVDGRSENFDTDDELGRLVHSGFVFVPPGGTLEVVLTLRGRLDLADDTYRLEVQRQPTINPDKILVRLPNGAERALSEGRTFTLRWRLSRR